ncbi:uncharacterized protein EDB91DRAFT_442369 [Suillus paluster]|uniref:uncharacterized protein n=1 Tax=Suillus paluster TaxID=48578 RepID=UPI001B87F986|nr:uncharacterized protein EDB91DRAFT_442369 [Suillus paluster]KAG1738935.1 hypothetical protein EDB91DRAFT_442369 [Suillus paluster]
MNERVTVGSAVSFSFTCTSGLRLLGFATETDLLRSEVNDCVLTFGRQRKYPCVCGVRSAYHHHDHHHCRNERRWEELWVSYLLVCFLSFANSVIGGEIAVERRRSSYICMLVTSPELLCPWSISSSSASPPPPPLPIGPSCITAWDEYPGRE